MTILPLRGAPFVPTRRHWLAILFGMLVLLGGGLYRSHQMLYGHARAMAEQHLESIAKLKSAEVQQWRNDRIMLLSQSPNGLLVQNFLYLLYGQDTAPAVGTLNAHFHYLQAHNPEISAIRLYDLGSRQILGGATSDLPLDELHQTAARQALESRAPVLVDFHQLDDGKGTVVLDVVAPLLSGPVDKLVVVGYAVFQIDPNRAVFPMIQRWPVPSATAESLLARREGEEVLLLNSPRLLTVAPMTMRRSLDTPGLIAAKALRGEGEVLSGVDYRGEPVIGALVRVPDTEWLLIAKMDESEIYVEARRSFITLAVGGILLAAVLLVLARVFVSALKSRAREARYRLLAESGSDMVWLYEIAADRFAYVSPAVVQLRGYTVAEALQQGLAEVLTPESFTSFSAALPGWMADFMAGDESARTRHFEVSLVCKNQTSVLTEAMVTLIVDEQGQVTHLQGISRDISERKRTEEALRKLSMAAEQSPVSITITNLDAEIEYVNEAFVKASGYSREEVMGRNPRLLKSGRTPAAAYSALWGNLLQGLPWQGELYNRRKDGSEYLVEAYISPIRQPDGRITHYLGLKEDITERRRIEAALAASEEKFHTIYDTINDGIFVHDAATGRILDVNASAARIYGYSREQLLELDVVALSANRAPYTMEGVQECIRQAMVHGSHTFEWLAQDSSGRQFWVVVNLQLMGSGENQRLLAVVRDVDRRKHAEEGLKQALEEAKALNRKLSEAQSQLLQSEKMASIGQLAAGVAHELNNPIGFVSSNLGMLHSYLEAIFSIMAAYEAAEKGPCHDCAQLKPIQAMKVEKDFEYIKGDIVQLMDESREGLARVTKIVRDLKDFSRAGDVEWQWADLHQGLDSTLNIVWNELKYKCTVTKDYGDLPQVWCVPSQLNQVFMNLLVNGAHAIPEKGDIHIRTGRQGDEVFVAISDSGSGIPPENLNRIFEPFFTTKPVGKGTGLGLSLAYSIVKKHQGRFDVQSELGQGTTFTVWLPIEAHPQVQDPDQGADGAPAQA